MKIPRMRFQSKILYWGQTSRNGVFLVKHTPILGEYPENRVFRSEIFQFWAKIPKIGVLGRNYRMRAKITKMGNLVFKCPVKLKKPFGASSAYFSYLIISDNGGLVTKQKYTRPPPLTQTAIVYIKFTIHNDYKTYKTLKTDKKNEM